MEVGIEETFIIHSVTYSLTSFASEPYYMREKLGIFSCLCLVFFLHRYSNDKQFKFLFKNQFKKEVGTGTILSDMVYA